MATAPPFGGFTPGSSQRRHENQQNVNNLTVTGVTFSPSSTATPDDHPASNSKASALKSPADKFLSPGIALVDFLDSSFSVLAADAVDPDSAPLNPQSLFSSASIADLSIALSTYQQVCKPTSLDASHESSISKNMRAIQSSTLHFESGDSQQSNRASPETPVKPPHAHVSIQSPNHPQTVPFSSPDPASAAVTPQLPRTHSVFTPSSTHPSLHPAFQFTLASSPGGPSLNQLSISPHHLFPYSTVSSPFILSSPLPSMLPHQSSDSNSSLLLPPSSTLSSPPPMSSLSPSPHPSVPSIPHLDAFQLHLQARAALEQLRVDKESFIEEVRRFERHRQQWEDKKQASQHMWEQSMNERHEVLSKLEARMEAQRTAVRLEQMQLRIDRVALQRQREELDAEKRKLEDLKRDLENHGEREHQIAIAQVKNQLEASKMECLQLQLKMQMMKLEHDQHLHEHEQQLVKSIQWMSPASKPNSSQPLLHVSSSGLLQIVPQHHVDLTEDEEVLQELPVEERKDSNEPPLSSCDISCQTNDAPYRTSEIACQTNDVPYQTSDTACQTNDTPHQTSDIACQTNDTPHQTSDTACQTESTSSSQMSSSSQVDSDLLLVNHAATSIDFGLISAVSPSPTAFLCSQCLLRISAPSPLQSDQAVQTECKESSPEGSSQSVQASPLPRLEALPIEESVEQEQLRVLVDQLRTRLSESEAKCQQLELDRSAQMGVMMQVQQRARDMKKLVEAKFVSPSSSSHVSLPQSASSIPMPPLTWSSTI